MRRTKLFLFLLFAVAGFADWAAPPLRGTGDLGVIIERASGRLQPGRVGTAHLNRPTGCEW